MKMRGLLGGLWLDLLVSLRATLHSLLHPLSLYTEFFTRTPPLPPPSTAGDAAGRVAVLTGATRGIGLEVLKALLKRNFHVFIGCRSVSFGDSVVSGLRAYGIRSGSVKVLPLDLKALSSVRSFAQAVLSSTDRLDLLINNAGIMFAPLELTEDGLESQFQVNYLAHFALTNHLLPLLKRTGDKFGSTRIINVSSDANYGGRLDLNDLGEVEKPTTYSSTKSYCDSKLCQILHARYLQGQLGSGSSVEVFSLHPGIIPSSDLWAQVPVIFLKLLGLIRFFFRSTRDGADTVMFTALSETLKGFGGSYVNSGAVTEPNFQAADEEAQRKLWERSLELTMDR